MVVLGLRSGGRGEREGFSLSFTRRVDKSRGETRKVALTNCDVVLSLSLSFQLLLLPSSLALCRRLISIDVVNSASTSTAFSLSVCFLVPRASGFGETFAEIRIGRLLRDLTSTSRGRSILLPPTPTIFRSAITANCPGK